MRIVSRGTPVGRPLACALLAVIALATPAMAEEYAHPSGFKVTLPGNWKVEEGDVLTASDPAEEVVLAFFVVGDAETLEAALNALDQALSPFIQDVQAGEPEVTKVNGLDAVVVDGTGKIEGQAVEIGIGIFAKDGVACVVFGAAESAKYAKHKPAIEKIIHSVKK